MCSPENTLINKILSLNPKGGEIGEGMLNLLQELAKESKERKNYRSCVSNFVKMAQSAAICGFTLRVVSAGSMYVTVSLTDSEYECLSSKILDITVE